ncbi:hypothetical protein QFZ20_004245 [Flavobacterium sp. W4I14]|nr:hypothetical protein [Flavobacterium sp. W4I14]
MYTIQIKPMLFKWQKMLMIGMKNKKKDWETYFVRTQQVLYQVREESALLSKTKKELSSFSP